MSRIQVRPCRDVDEVVSAIRAIAEYGAWPIDREDAERWLRTHRLERMLAALDGGRVIGGCGSFEFEMTVPGATVATAGVTVVGVLPTHRRRGVLTRMMRRQLDDVHERGEPVAALWASDERIYGRYGYGLAQLVGSMQLPRDHSAFAVPFEARGRVRTVEQSEAQALFPPVWDAVRRQVPGMLARSREWWELRILRDPPEWRPPGAGPKRFALLELDGGAGYAIYRHAPKWEDGEQKGSLNAIEVVATTFQAEAELWRYLFDIEWVATIAARLLPLDHTLFHLLAEPRQMRFRVGDALWVRLVDVGAALSRRSYASDGTIVIEVEDAFCSWNAGRWRLSDGRARRTTVSPHLRCDVSALGSAYLGAFGFTQLARSGRVEELRRGAAARADAVFRWHRAPWCPEIF